MGILVGNRYCTVLQTNAKESGLLRAIIPLGTVMISTFQKDHFVCSVDYTLEGTKTEARKIILRTVLRIQARFGDGMSESENGVREKWIDQLIMVGFEVWIQRTWEMEVTICFQVTTGSPFTEMDNTRRMRFGKKVWYPLVLIRAFNCGLYPSAPTALQTMYRVRPLPELPPSHLLLRSKIGLQFDAWKLMGRILLFAAKVSGI